MSSDGLEPTEPGAPGDAGLAETAADSAAGALDATASPDPSAGGATGSPFDLTATPYERRGMLGRGGMGQVILAHDRRLGRTVAIKELLTPSDAGRARFEREVRLAARLQHPNIVPVYEAGTTARGEPYYAMRPVDGRTLGQAIDLAQTTAARLALVPRVTAVAEALAFAHAKGVIHRDLKPNNILIGEFGETVVIDWGLAKELGETADEPSLPSGVGSTDLTHHGSVIGTPSYMPPEQARGAVLDARADVYAIGAILYHVLAGVPPYHGAKTAEQLIERVRSGPPARLTELAPDVPADLAAVVERAMARDPTFRYAEARGLADDLTRFTTGRLVSAHSYSARQLVRRWLGRHRVAVAIAAVAVAVLAGVGVYSVLAIRDERTTAVRERAAAVERQHEVEGLVDFVLKDLHARLEASGDLTALRGGADRIADYLARHPPAPGDRIGLRRRIALELQIASVANATGKLEDAQHRLEAALAVAEPLAPGDAELTDLAHRALKDLAAVQQRRGAPGAAMTTIERALAIAAREAGRGALNWRRLHADDLFSRSVLHGALGDAAGERADLETALAQFRAVVAEAPDNRVAQRDVARSISRLATLASHDGDDAKARDLGIEAATLFERLAATQPDQILERDDLLLALQRQGRYQLDAGDPQAARRTIERSRALAEGLVRDDPARPEHAQSLALTLTELARLSRTDKDYPEALALGRRAIELLTHLTEIDAANMLWLTNVAEAHDQLAATLRESGDRRGAIAAYEPAFAIRRRLIELAPAVFEHAIDLGRDKLKVGEFHAALGEHAAAVAATREALAALAPAIAAQPTQRTPVVISVIACLTAGDELVAARDRPGAAASYDRGDAILDAFVAAGGSQDESLTELRAALTKARATCCK